MPGIRPIIGPGSIGPRDRGKEVGFTSPDPLDLPQESNIENAPKGDPALVQEAFHAFLKLPPHMRKLLSQEDFYPIVSLVIGSLKIFKP